MSQSKWMDQWETQLHRIFICKRVTTGWLRLGRGLYLKYCTLTCQHRLSTLGPLDGPDCQRRLLVLVRCSHTSPVKGSTSVWTLRLLLAWRMTPIVHQTWAGEGRQGPGTLVGDKRGKNRDRMICLQGFFDRSAFVLSGCCYWADRHMDHHTLQTTTFVVPI